MNKYDRMNYWFKSGDHKDHKDKWSFRNDCL